MHDDAEDVAIELNQNPLAQKAHASRIE